MHRTWSLLLLTTSLSHAATLIAPTGGSYVSPTSQVLTFGPFGPTLQTDTHVVPDDSLGSVQVTNVINGAGLSGVPTLTNYTSITHVAPSFTPGAANAWSSVAPGGAGSDFFPAFDQSMSNINRTDEPVGYFNLTFDTTVNLTDLVSWSYNFGGEFNGNNVSRWQLFTFDSSGSPLDQGEFAGPASMGNGEPVTISFGKTFANVSAVHLYPIDNYYGSPNATGGDRIGVAELRFIAADPVPEPGAVVSGLLGLGMIGLRRHRSFRNA